MEKQEHDRISAFDSLYTTNHIQIMKILLPYFDHPLHSRLAVYIKYLEFQYALSCFGSHSHELYGCSPGREDFNANSICAEILPFCTKEEKHQIEQAAGLMRSMETFREISAAMEMFKNISPDFLSDLSPNLFQEGCSSGQAAPGNMTDLLMNMLSPEQKAMFEMFGGNGAHDSK